MALRELPFLYTLTYTLTDIPVHKCAPCANGIKLVNPGEHLSNIGWIRDHASGGPLAPSWQGRLSEPHWEACNWFHTRTQWGHQPTNWLSALVLVVTTVKLHSRPWGWHFAIIARICPDSDAGLSEWHLFLVFVLVWTQPLSTSSNMFKRSIPFSTCSRSLDVCGQSKWLNKWLVNQASSDMLLLSVGNQHNSCVTLRRYLEKEVKFFFYHNSRHIFRATDKEVGVKEHPSKNRIYDFSFSRLITNATAWIHLPLYTFLFFHYFLSLKSCLELLLVWAISTLWRWGCPWTLVHSGKLHMVQETLQKPSNPYLTRTSASKELLLPWTIC